MDPGRIMRKATRYLQTVFFFFFKIFDFQIFTIFFFFFVNMGLYGNQIFKTLLLPQFQSDVNQTLW